MITFKDLAGVGSWGAFLTLLLVLVGFFSVPVLLGVGAVYAATRWRASR